MKKKVLLVLDSDLYVRNYIRTGTVNYLSKVYDLEILFSKKIENYNDILLLKSVKKNYEFNSFFVKLFYYLNDIAIYLNRKKSSSFTLRIENTINRMSIPWKFLKIISLNSLFFYALKKILNLYLYNFNEINNYLLKNKFKLVIFPSSGLDLMSYYLPLITKRTDIKTFFIVDNWDNISSKSYYLEKPSHIGVWGYQSKQHAYKIQDFEKKKIFLTGSARFQVYKRNFPYKKIYKFPYILFLGASVLSKEQELLCITNKIIENNKKLFKNTKIIYRPHPWRQKQDRVLLEGLENVIIDRQLKLVFDKNTYETDDQPDLKYYPKLIYNSELIMGGLTSMLVESLILEKNYLAFVFNDKNIFYNPSKRVERLEHFKILKKIEDVKICNKINYDIIEKILINQWKNKKIINKKNLNYYVNKIVITPQPNYNKNLVRLIDRII
jgi:hypothetical protein